MILIAELINHFVNGNVNMATVKKTIKKAQNGTSTKKEPPKMKFKTSENWADNYSVDTTGLSKGSSSYYPYTRSNGTRGVFTRNEAKSLVNDVKSGKIKKSDWEFKSGGMLKRADGSYSKRGLWDNIRANKGSGKKPTAAMLKQEKKIKAKTKK